MVFNELGNSQGSFSYITPSSDLDMDDTTLGKLLTEAHREYADYRNPEGVSVSQSSLSVVFDRTGKLVGERNVDQSIGFGVTRNTYSAHSKFSESTQAEKVIDRTGKNVGENSSNAQIRILLDEQRQMIIAEYCEKIGHHELQAARAEEERRILQGPLTMLDRAKEQLVKLLQAYHTYCESRKVLLCRRVASVRLRCCGVLRGVITGSLSKMDQSQIGNVQSLCLRILHSE